MTTIKSLILELSEKYGKNTVLNDLPNEEFVTGSILDEAFNLTDWIFDSPRMICNNYRLWNLTIWELEIFLEQQ